MRSQITALLLTVTLAISANAAAFDKRDVSPAVQVCIDSITSVGTQLTKASPSINAFSSQDGYTGAYAIHQQEQLIEADLKKANDACCPLDTLSLDEVYAIHGVVAELVPEVVKVLGTIVSKKLEFNDLTLATTLLKKDIKAVNGLTTSLTSCLINKVSLQESVSAIALKTELDNAFAAVEAL